MTKVSGPRALLVVGAILAANGMYAQSSASSAKTASALKDFHERVEQYSKLQRAVPRLRKTGNPQELEDRRHALAQKIQDLRKDAKPGDMFTPHVAAHLRKSIAKSFRSSKAAGIRRTIQQGEPQAGWKLQVNAEYPEGIPLTTMPPTLLRHLPPLQKDLEYRIVGHDFVLVDTEARIVVDFIPNAIP